MGQGEPLPAEALGSEAQLRCLVQGYPKCGKSTTIIASCVDSFGYGLAINCGTQAGLKPALRRTGPGKWDFLQAEYEPEMEVAITHARKGSKAGKYRWIYVDDFNYFCLRAEAAMIDNELTQKDFNRYPKLRNRMLNVVRRLFECDAHVIIATHLDSWSSKPLDGQNPKEAPGFVNSLPGKLRTELPGICTEVIVLSLDKDGSRNFIVAQRGVYGVGCRSFDSEKEEIEADVGALAAYVEAGTDRKKQQPKPQINGAPAKPASKPPTPVPAKPPIVTKPPAPAVRKG